MTHDTRPTVSRRNLVRALLGRETPTAGPAKGDSPALLHAPGDAAYAAGDYPAAVAAYRASIRSDLSNAAARIRLGHALYELGQYIQARVEFEHVLRLTDGNDRFARLRLGLTFLALGKGERAATTLAVYADPDRPELEAAAGNAARRLAAGEVTDLTALRQELESLAQATALLPESATT